MSEFRITRSQAEIYRIRGAHTWADITIDANGETGRISIASDFGDWQYYWGCCGMPFKEFLCKIDKHYAAGKFGASKWFDAEATMAHYRQLADEHLGNFVISEENHLDIMNDIEELSNYYNQPEMFAHEAYTSAHLSKLFDGSCGIQYDLEPGFRQFWEQIWPVFIDQLKSETDAQK